MTRKRILRADNTRPHIAKSSIGSCAKLHLRVAPDPPYSPDLAPSDYLPFGDIKDMLKGLFFRSALHFHRAIKQTVQSIDGSTSWFLLTSGSLGLSDVSNWIEYLVSLRAAGTWLAPSTGCLHCQKGCLNDRRYGNGHHLPYMIQKFSSPHFPLYCAHICNGPYRPTDASGILPV